MDPAELNDKMDHIAEIAPNGDVVLAVGPQAIRLRVHSQFLRSASKVFDAMFSPPWTEGHGTSEQCPQEKQLPDDDAEAMRTICCLLHHRNDEVPQSLTLRETLQIAIVADKYDLGVALKYANAQWLKPRDNDGGAEIGYLLAAAFLLRDTEMFAAHSLNLILRHKGSYSEFMDDEIIGQIVPWKTFYLMEERRTRMRAEVYKLLTRGKGAACSSCEWGKSRGELYSHLLLNYSPMELLDISISEITAQMENFSTRDMRSGNHGGIWSDTHDTMNKSQALDAELDRIKRKASICLDCVQGEVPSTPCRFPHE